MLLLIGGVSHVTGTRSRTFNTTLCVFNPDFDKQSLLEFLSFHALIGVDSYLIYSDAIPYRLTKILSNFQSRLGVKITFLPWNYPTTVKPSNANAMVQKTLVEADCLLRTAAHSRRALLLEPDEYLVPIFGKSADDILDSYALTAASARLAVGVHEFCRDSFKRHLPTALQNFKGAPGGGQVYVHNHELKERGKTGFVDKEVAKVHKYRGSCEGVATKTDKSMLRYYTDFSRATLVQLLLHDKI